MTTWEWPLGDVYEIPFALDCYVVGPLNDDSLRTAACSVPLKHQGTSGGAPAETAGSDRRDSSGEASDCPCIGVASALVSTSQQIGGVLGVAI